MTMSAVDSSWRSASAVVVEIDCVGQLPEVHPIEERGLAATGAVGSARAFHLDDDGAGASEQLCAQRTRPQRRQIGHQQAVHPPRPDAAADLVAPPVAPRRLPPDRLPRYRAAGRGQPQPRSNALPPNQKAQARGRREPRRLPAAPAASQRHPRAATRPRTSRPRWPAVGWRRPPRRGRDDSARGSPPGPPIWWRRRSRHLTVGRYRRLPGGLRPAQRRERSPAARQRGRSDTPARCRPSPPP